MKLSRKTNSVLLILLSGLNVVFRLPTTPHEIGIDSFFIHGLANSISIAGYAKWIIHPLSSCGMYPMSYSSSYPFILSGISQNTGISVEYAILVFTITLGVFSVFSSYLMAKEIRDDDFFAFLVAFAFSLSPEFLHLSIWTATTRNLFTAFFPLFIWLLLRCVKFSNAKYLLPTIIIFIILVTTHRVFLLGIPIVLVALLITVVITVIGKKKLYFSGHKKIIFYSLLTLFLFSFFIQFSNLGFFSSGMEAYQSGAFFRGSEPHILLLNLLIDYGGKIGILLPFGLLGLISLIHKPDKTFNENFLMIATLFLIPLLSFSQGTYAPYVILSFISILSIIGFTKMCSIFKNNKKLVFAIISITLLISASYSVFMLNYWQSKHFTNYMTEETYTAAFFIKGKTNSGLVSNNGVTSARIFAVAGRAILPFGGPYVGRNSPEQLIFDFVDFKELNRDLLLPITITPKPRVAYVGEIPNANDDWTLLMDYNCNSSRAKDILSGYDIHIFVDYTPLKGDYLYWVTRYSRFILSTYDTRDKIFSNGEIDVWYLG